MNSPSSAPFDRQKNRRVSATICGLPEAPDPALVSALAHLMETALQRDGNVPEGEDVPTERTGEGDAPPLSVLYSRGISPREDSSCR